MRKSLVTFSFFVMVSFSLQAQTASERRLFMLIDSIAESSIQCSYRYSLLEGSKRQGSIAILQISPKLSKFSSELTYYSDSLGLTLGNRLHPGQKLDDISEKFLRHRADLPLETLFDNYPEGKVTITQSLAGIEHYLSEEERTMPEWTFVRDSTRNIMGRDCQLATTELHGRRWSVWFAPSMPMPYGPWLLRGLPGLVVEAYDSEREHEFLLVEVRKSRSPIGFRRRSHINTSRQKVMRHIKSFRDNSTAFFKRWHQQRGFNTPLPQAPPRPYNPIRKMTGK